MQLSLLKRALTISLATAACFAGAATSVRAETSHEYYYQYYADEDHTQLVGGFLVRCPGEGGSITWGESTIYSEYVYVRECPE